MALVVASACTSAPLSVRPQGSAAAAPLPAPATAAASPDGALVVAYPNEPSVFLRPVGEEPAVDDLAALWGLPLFRIDDQGQVRRGLVEDWTVVGTTTTGWRVDLRLREGAWTDGTPVDAADVVASLRRAVRTQPRRFGVLTDITRGNSTTVQLTFDRPYTSWLDLLVEAGSMLPSATVKQGVGGFDNGVPVSGGLFSLASYTPGLSAVFDATTGGPLGKPRTSRITILFAPAYATGLRLLERGRVDVMLGYLALDPVTPAQALDGVEAAAPLGGTTVSLEFGSDGRYGPPDAADLRRGLTETVNVSELVEGGLGPFAALARTPWPGIDPVLRAPPGEVRGGEQATLTYPRGSDVLEFTARIVQRNLTGRGVRTDLVDLPAPQFAASGSSQLSLRVRRTGPRPSLSPWVTEPATAYRGGAAPLGSSAVRDALTAVAVQRRIAPLFRVAVLHAWRGVDGIRPSAWFGAGFWNAGEWARAE